MRSATIWSRCLPWMLLAGVLGACEEPPPWARPGDLFARPEAPPPDKALIYVYWPAGGPGSMKRVWVSVGAAAFEEVQRGTYSSVAVAPGSTAIRASAYWILKSGFHSTVSQDYGGIQLNLRAGQVRYLQIDQSSRLGVRRFDFLLDRSEALLEIRNCRRMEEPLRYLSDRPGDTGRDRQASAGRTEKTPP